MKRIGMKISMLVLAGSLAGTALAADGVISKNELGSSSNYCNERFPAIRPRTLASDQPELKGEQTGDTIDYYGPCTESPTGADQVQVQKLDEFHHYTGSPGGRF